MGWEEALEIVINATRHEPYRRLCAEEHPQHEVWRQRMIDKAEGTPQALPAPPPHPMPSFFQQAKNFGKAVIGHVQDGLSKVSPERQEARMAICRSCDEYYDAEAVRCRHPQCGCLLRIKTSWASQSCPIGRWPAVGADGKPCNCGKNPEV